MIAQPTEQAHAMSHPHATEQWRDLEARLAFAHGLIDSMVKDSIRLRSEICELTKRLGERNDVRNSVVAVGAADAHNAPVRGNPGDSHVHVVHHHTLTLLPDPDARLGRGNSAMDAT
jgi:hypothetical protein